MDSLTACMMESQAFEAEVRRNRAAGQASEVELKRAAEAAEIYREIAKGRGIIPLNVRTLGEGRKR